MRPNHQGLLSDAAAAESSQIAQGLQRRRGMESTLSSLDKKSPRLVPPSGVPHRSRGAIWSGLLAVWNGDMCVVECGEASSKGR